MRGRLFISACLIHSLTPQGLSFDTPMWRILPALTSSFSAPSVSSIGTLLRSRFGLKLFEPKIGTFRLGQCTW